VGHAERWDAMQVDGVAERRDLAVRFERSGKTLALATVFRDEQNLRMELELERGGR